MRNRPAGNYMFVIGLATVAAAVALMFCGPVLQWLPTASAQEPLATPPDQNYVGAKACASCHFEQFMAWKKDKHSQAFALLEGAYKKDAKCLPCHTTGYGKPSGYKGAEADLANVTCESCHGPGSAHVDISKKFTGQTLTDQQTAYVKSTIYAQLPGNSCLECHITKAHKPSVHPAK